MLIVSILVLARSAAAQDPGGTLRGVVYDKDFDTPLAGAEVLVVETGQTATTSDAGNYVLTQVPPGVYTLVFAKEGYVRQVRAGVTVSAGQLTDVDASLSGEFTEMDEFLVQDVLQFGAGSEAQLLDIRFKSSSIIDSIGADLMSKAGAGDAAAALKLVSGATVQDGKYAVVRGLPDRYVSSQMNGVRLPSADEDKRAVELDQFPAAVIESIQVSKTFTPDQQGDASGGAVDVRLKSLPDETVLQISGQVSGNTNVMDSDFLTYDGGGVDFWGDAKDDKDPQPVGTNWEGAVGVEEGDPPTDYKFSATAGGKEELDDGVKIGGLASFFYEADSSSYEDGTDDSYWVELPGDGLTPQKKQQSGLEDFKTALFDVSESTQSVQWGGLGVFGIETEKHAIGLTYLYSRTSEDKAILAEDTRGKDVFTDLFGYGPYDPNAPTGPEELAPYLRTETLEYTERTADTLQLHGEHQLPGEGFTLSALKFKAPELDWVLSNSSAKLDQPDKRLFGAMWIPAGSNPVLDPAIWLPYKPSPNFTIGNVQRIWKTIDEESDQYSVNLKLPFEQWSGDEGYFKFGVFDDSVERTFDQDTFSNFNDTSPPFVGSFEDFWSAAFPGEGTHPFSAAEVDVDYDGEISLSAFYGMVDMPVSSEINVITGARFESTEIGIVNDPESEALWLEPGTSQPTTLEPGEADVSFDQDDVLPMLGLVYEPSDDVTIRTSFSETVARQTFKELTPIVQQEYLGSDVFIGNPDLQMSALTNYDLRVDYRPYEGSLISGSWFRKDIDDPIEYVQQPLGYVYTTPTNYPEGELTGWEVELRQSLGRFWESAEGLSVGVNATLLDAEVTLPDDEVLQFAALGVDLDSRDMTNAPEHIYNLYFTYEFPGGNDQCALFYTLTGDTLVAGAGEALSHFVPSVYAKEFGTLNLSYSHKYSDSATLTFQAKNLTDPDIEEFYDGSEIGQGDVTKTSYSLGREFSVGMTIRF